MDLGSAIVLLPDGVGVRNFLLGKFLGTFAQNRQTCVLHSIAPSLLPTYREGLPESIRWEPFDHSRERPREFIYRFALTYGQMHWGKTRSMRHILKRRAPGSWKQRAAHRAARLLGRLNASADGLQKLARTYHAMIDRKPLTAAYRRLFEELAPKVLFCSHQRPHAIAPAALAARQLAVPTAVFIFSWDNLSSKGRMPAPFDHYLVWSELMRDELLRYYPDVDPDKIHIVGTPQFDPYADEALAIPRQAFFEGIGADPERPLICFSGGDTGTCPEDPQHLAILMKLIRDGAIEGAPQVLARPSPADDGARYDPVRRDFPELLFAPPDWHRPPAGGWAAVTPARDDIPFLANLIRHADVNVNMASTMTLDFATHDKPAVNLAFDAADPPRFGKPIWDVYYRFEHYRAVVDCGAARFARSPDELARWINAYLADPALDRDNRKRLLDLEVGWPLGQSYTRVIEVLDRIAGGAA